MCPKIGSLILLIIGLILILYPDKLEKYNLFSTDRKRKAWIFSTFLLSGCMFMTACCEKEKWPEYPF